MHDQHENTNKNTAKHFLLYKILALQLDMQGIAKILKELLLVKKDLKFACRVLSRYYILLLCLDGTKAQTLSLN